MKIFVKNYDIKTLDKFMKLLDKYYISSEINIQLYSKEGIFTVDNNAFFKIKTIDKDIVVVKNYYKSFTLLIDHSINTYENSHQLPVEHMAFTIKKCCFATNNTSKIKLIIEGNNDIENSTNMSFSKEYNMVPSNFYFDISDEIDINNDFVKQELNVFLSLLNL